jgi:hypothetical protein
MKLPKQVNLPIYRCPSHNDCACHVTINAEIAEEVVVSAVRQAIADAQGRASAAENVQEVVAAREAAQTELDAAIRCFASAGLENEPAAIERLGELRKARDEAIAREDQLRADALKLITAGKDRTASQATRSGP